MPQELVARTKKILQEKAGSDIRKFLEHLIEGVPVTELKLLEPETLADIAVNHARLLQKLNSDNAEIGIYTPGAIKKDWQVPHTAVDIVMKDMSFIVDSVTAEINRHGHLIDVLLHPVIKGISHIHARLQCSISPEEIEELHRGLELVLEDVLYANNDWHKMLGELETVGSKMNDKSFFNDEGECQECRAFVDFLGDDNFTFLGYTSYVYDKDTDKAREKSDSALGILSRNKKNPRLSGIKEGLPEERPAKKWGAPITICKTRQLSKVHRSVPMDVIKFRYFDSAGNVAEERIFTGLFTSQVYTRSVAYIPYIRRKVEKVIEDSGFPQGSHDRRALLHILEKYPRDELFQIKTRRLKEISHGILRLQERQKVTLYTREDRLGRFISCLVYIPRDRYDTVLRLNFQRTLEKELGGKCNAFYTTLDDSVFARLLIIIDFSGSKKIPEYSEESLQNKLQEAGSTWSEQLRDALAAATENRESFLRLYDRYSEAFPSDYFVNYQPYHGVRDIHNIEKVLNSKSIALDLYQPEEKGEKLRLKMYVPGTGISLSDILPILENMGLKVITEMTFDIRPDSYPDIIWIHDFLFEISGSHYFPDIAEIKDKFETALKKIWCGGAENDGLNKLVFTAAMSWREIMVLRTYVHYMRQIRVPYSMRFMEKTLADNPKIARLLVDMFTGYFNPESTKKSTDIESAGFGVAIDHELEKVPSLDHDHVLRTAHSLVEATVRTNYFQVDEKAKAKPCLCLKLDSSKIGGLPAPKPFTEIFVYSPRTEGVHLRGGKISRGGLRWSDRAEDFRTEVLGLMKAQMVKNAVIIPVGAKGGFIVKRPPKNGSKDDLQKEAIECYKIFISGLLDITDNRKNGEIIPPRNVVRRDGDDPYLVVAADKGTATFSDIANAVSEEYGFWMGDAFASGGSSGYDHKKMGITAKGAWESVKRHFRELGHDTQSSDFDVIGVGDMAGDVFGNGMLLSRHIRLIGAFNHLHIFCDPCPDPEKSFRERQRLFNNALGWDGYNKDLLSKGGQIYSRSEKSLKLTPEIKKRFEISADRVTPAELIKAMLKAETDLLWFGGIGTFIKATEESHANVGDKGNDMLRVNAADIRAKVIGEGANLAITQPGRVEYALAGGKINTDFIDNSGGVDTSDHEVNIKILLSRIMAGQKNKLSPEKRNRLLKDMADGIAADVLYDNYQQAMALSLAEMQQKEQFSLYKGFIRDLEREEGLDRKVESLPSEKEITGRIQEGKGFTRPELALLMSYAKITFTKDLLACDIPDNPDMGVWLLNYFPEILRHKYGEEIRSHRLRREIIATSMANALVNRMGPVFVKSLMIRTGASCADVAKAYFIVLEAFGFQEIWDSIEALDDEVETIVQTEILHSVSLLAQNAINWVLSQPGRSPDITSDIPAFRKGIKSLVHNIDNIVSEDLQKEMDRSRKRVLKQGLPEILAQKISLIPALRSACDIVRIADENSFDVTVTAKLYFTIGNHFRLEWLRCEAGKLRHDSRWTSDAVNGLINSLYRCQAKMTAQVLHCSEENDYNCFEEWLDNNASQVRQVETMLAEIRQKPTPDLPVLIVAEQRLRFLCSSQEFSGALTEKHIAIP
jgi:glutamate dehydrogenase